MLSSDESAFRPMTLKNTNFYVLTDISAPYTLAPSSDNTLISSGIVLGMLMESYNP